MLTVPYMNFRAAAAKVQTISYKVAMPTMKYFDSVYYAFKQCFYLHIFKISSTALSPLTIKTNM